LPERFRLRGLQAGRGAAAGQPDDGRGASARKARGFEKRGGGIAMGNSGLRRMRKKAKMLRELADSNPEGFKRLWDEMVEGWADEANRRGRRLSKDEQSGENQESVFGVAQRAKDLLLLCGGETARLAGSESLPLLEAECARVFALAVEPKLYRLSVDPERCRARKKA
jgi:hypothetical protein